MHKKIIEVAVKLVTVTAYTCTEIVLVGIHMNDTVETYNFTKLLLQ